MSVRYQRLIIIIFSLVLIASAIFLILFNSKKNFVFFLTPTELINSSNITTQDIRIGGYVKANSFIKLENNSYKFIITDKKNEIKVTYSGILPDLFREGQGVVAEGSLSTDGVFVAREVLAKHDENYMPKEVIDTLKEQGVYKKVNN